jgi:VIT1/CCC1 family predicted Fe2+/Mn2+ transporter
MPLAKRQLELNNRLGNTETIRNKRSHFSDTSGSLRAAVLGVNDGLVSNFSLVMGVVGGTSNTNIVLLAGVAGLLSGAFSMAAGEYISMRSQRDVYEHQIALKKNELEMCPEDEEKKLALIYHSKGLSKEEAETIANRIMSNPKVALDTLIIEELGLNQSGLGSPWLASISSFTAFVAGALVPILPYIFGVTDIAIPITAFLSAIALLTVGGALAWMNNKSVTSGALRMAIAGGTAAAVTFSIGSIIGISLPI